MSISVYEVGNFKPICCYYESTPSGFNHVAEYNGFKAKCHYINRTWERFTYETVLYRLFSKILEWKKDVLKSDLNMRTKAGRAEFENRFNNSNFIKDVLNAIDIIEKSESEWDLRLN